MVKKPKKQEYACGDMKQISLLRGVVELERREFGK